MELDGVHLRRLVPPALMGDHVYEGRPVVVFHSVPQDGFQFLDIVPVNGANVAEAYLFPDHVGDDDPLQAALDAVGQPPDHLSLG